MTTEDQGREAGPVRGLRPRLGRLFAIAAGVTLPIGVLLTLPALFGLLPSIVQDNPVEWSALALVVGYEFARRAARDDSAVRRLLDRLDASAGWALRRGLAMLLALSAAGLLATWLPHYLTWPWSRDCDTFAVLAQSWDAGIRPYRDILAYNFPGPTYQFWVLGKTFGWGRTASFYAFDAAVFVSLGVAMVAWSRRRLGGPLPGLGAYLALLAIYLGTSYERVGERDWYTAVGVSLGLMALQAWPGRAGRLASALAVAVALTFRPHAVLFLPALASAIDENARQAGEPRAKAVRALAEWSVALVAFAALAFAPLFLSGIFDDMLRGLRIVAYGGPYSRATPRSVAAAFLGQFRNGATDALFASTLLLAATGLDDRRRLARTWSLAWLGVLVYRPIHPVQHAYLALPLILVRSIAVALPIDRLRDAGRLARPIRLLAILLLLYEMVPEVPRYCSVDESLRALGPLARGEEPVIPPLGSLQAYLRLAPPTNWDDYRATLAYLRATTRPTTFVANALNRYPFGSINGPTGRLSPFLAESGLCWKAFVRIDLDAEFAAELERTPNSVVVWDPLQRRADPRLKYPRLFATIRRLYEPAARFGQIEVWRRKAAPGGP